jgi:hypothetical protein
MTEAIRKALIKKIVQRAVGIAQKDPVMHQLLQQNKGESMLFYIEDLKLPFGIEIVGTSIRFAEEPDLKKSYGLVATCKEDAIIYMLRGLDPEDAFFYGYIEVTGKGWFKKVMILKRMFKLGEDRGLKQQVVQT